MNLHDVHRAIKKNKPRRRIGRGKGSGYGKTAGRGHKGARSRSGWKSSSTFEGGQTPLVRRTPKRGFHNRFAKTIHEINVAQLDRRFESGSDVTVESLKARGLAKGRFDILKVLGDGELTKSLNVFAHRFSRAAREKIEQAGGKATVVSENAPTAATAAATA